MTSPRPDQSVIAAGGVVARVTSCPDCGAAMWQSPRTRAWRCSYCGHARTPLPDVRGPDGRMRAGCVVTHGRDWAPIASDLAGDVRVIR